MDDDGRIISFEEAQRRRRAVEEAQRKKGVIHEVKLSDAMSHLLEDAGSPEAAAGGDQGSSTERPGPEGRVRPHLVEADEQDRGGQVCSFETRRCWDPDESPKGSPPD
jgi:hypothetical protein